MKLINFGVSLAAASRRRISVVSFRSAKSHMIFGLSVVHLRKSWSVQRFVRRENYICRTGNKMIICRKQYLALLFEGNSFSITVWVQTKLFFQKRAFTVAGSHCQIVCFWVSSVRVVFSSQHLFLQFSTQISHISDFPALFVENKTCLISNSELTNLCNCVVVLPWYHVLALLSLLHCFSSARTHRLMFAWFFPNQQPLNLVQCEETPGPPVDFHLLKRRSSCALRVRQLRFISLFFLGEHVCHGLKFSCFSTGKSHQSSWKYMVVWLTQESFDDDTYWAWAQGNAVAMKGAVARDALFVTQPSGEKLLEK